MTQEEQNLYDKVAIAAMQGILTTSNGWPTARIDIERCPIIAFEYADAFMSERARRLNQK